MRQSKQNNGNKDALTMEKDKNTTDDTWTLEKANALVDELLKDIPVIPAKGSVIWPVRKPYLSVKENSGSQTKGQTEKNLQKRK